MPKTRSTKRISSYRLEPYPTRSRSVGTLNSQQVGDAHYDNARSSQPYFRFEDLPVDIQLEVFDCFSLGDPNYNYSDDLAATLPETAAMPLADVYCRPATPEDAADSSISITRRSILLTSRRVNEVFSPMFYRSTVFVIRRRPQSCTFEAYKLWRLSDFTNVFFKSPNMVSMVSPRAQYIQRIDFDATLYVEASSRALRSGEQFVDVKDTTSFVRFLQDNIRDLPGLKEVRIFARQSRPKVLPPWPLTELASRARYSFLRRTTSSFMTCIRKLDRRGRRAIFQDWNSAVIAKFKTSTKSVLHFDKVGMRYFRRH